MFSFDSLTVQGAYGRSYTSKKAALADWDTGKDFKIQGGPYLSNRDVDALKKDGRTKLVFILKDQTQFTHRL